MYVLCCDLGGTFGDWGIFNKKTQKFDFSENYRVSDYDSFYAMAENFLSAIRERYLERAELVDCFCLAAAGPTDGREVRPTNIPAWRIELEVLRRALLENGIECPAVIVNDFEALAHGVSYLNDRGLKPTDFKNVFGKLSILPPRGYEAPKSRSLICGPGSGLGVALAINRGEKREWQIVSSEAGHLPLAPETNIQYDFLGDGVGKLSTKTYENMLSHSGLVSLYNYYIKKHKIPGQIEDYGITSDEVIKKAVGGDSVPARDAVDLFCVTLAGFCGNMVLAFNCDRAVYLWGGVVISIPEDLLISRFKEYYAKRPQFSSRVRDVPVVLLQNDETALYGCTTKALDHIGWTENQ